MMKQGFAELRPLYLSEDEALALLDLCMISQSDTSLTHEQALLKLSNLTRRFLRAASENQDGMNDRCEPMAYPAVRDALFA